MFHQFGLKDLKGLEAKLLAKDCAANESVWAVVSFDVEHHEVAKVVNAEFIQANKNNDTLEQLRSRLSEKEQDWLLLLNGYKSSDTLRERLCNSVFNPWCLYICSVSNTSEKSEDFFYIF